MAGTRLAGEVLGGVCLLLVLIACAFVLRRQAIARGCPLMLMARQKPSGWTLGMARVTASEVCWFPFLGFSVRPRDRWVRGDLDLGAPLPIHGGRPVSMPDAVSVSCSSRAGDFTIALSSADYTALRSWAESAPPGLNANVA
ncbi:DUF2550 family protein [Luteipulveratus sp. YIM 133132]|uniref:DUF2550 family protein n=1 Tax=Luteipulveratus flavus TaxID=3031728 RepID=A0ABT6C885_9MICO|nr:MULTISPECIES: DUF2550 family protein [unclassified Luteipulveratus]MDE9365951.1 DUF2550 family protein [Luteipulveratus sp. YIM 133132]MDF8265141.1 DUF2550 family protein [Luteipulveratus sp. YIM 133296]